MTSSLSEKLQAVIDDTASTANEKTVAKMLLKKIDSGCDIEKKINYVSKNRIPYIRCDRCHAIEVLRYHSGHFENARCAMTGSSVSGSFLDGKASPLCPYKNRRLLDCCDPCGEEIEA